MAGGALVGAVLGWVTDRPDDNAGPLVAAIAYAMVGAIPGLILGLFLGLVAAVLADLFRKISGRPLTVRAEDSSCRTMSRFTIAAVVASRKQRPTVKTAWIADDAP